MKLHNWIFFVHSIEKEKKSAEDSHLYTKNLPKRLYLSSCVPMRDSESNKNKMPTNNLEMGDEKY